MKKYMGQGVSDGVCVGRVVVWRRKVPTSPSASLDALTADEGWARFLAARDAVRDELAALYRESRERLGEESAAIFDVQSMMAEDEEVAAMVRERLYAGTMPVDEALQQVKAGMVTRFSSMQDDYLQQRAADAEAVLDRILAYVTGEESEETVLPGEEPCILCADDLTPAQTAKLDRHRLLGFITAHGSPLSHTAILARSMGLPALLGVGEDAIAVLQDGDTVAMDAGEGWFGIDPDAQTLASLEERRWELARGQERLAQFRGKPTLTRSGRRIHLYANAALPEDIETVLQGDAEGIGLFRSEFLYLGRATPPDEEEQYRIYCDILTRMRGRQVIIRTLDIGADKQARCLPPLQPEENPALGCRAVRYSLRYPSLFMTQARALLRASACGDLAVMFPLVCSEEEVRGLRSLWGRAAEEVGVDAGAVSLGIMIETPAAALISDKLARMVDFFSIGTNDLTQYTLAMDRQNEALEPFYRPHHPAILSLIRMTVENARAAGIWVGICGELGADATLTETFVRMGVDELSVAPSHILTLRERIAQIQ